MDQRGDTGDERGQVPAGSDADATARAAEGFEPVDAGLTWQWRFSDDAGVEADRPAPAFDSQAAAEAWLSEHFAALLDDGVAAASLFDGERIEYGPMPLTP